MKYVIAILSLALFFSTTATADDLQILTKEVNGETIIICVIPEEMGEIEMAYIRFYTDNEKILPTRNCEMEIIGKSNAAYTVPGTHQVLEGKVKILVADLSKKIIRKDFMIKKGTISFN